MNAWDIKVCILSLIFFLFSSSDPKTEKFLGHMKGHTDWITRFATYGDYLFTGSADTTLRAWDLKAISQSSIPCIGVFSGHTKPITAIEIFDDLLFSGSVDCTIRIWTFKPAFQQRVSVQMQIEINFLRASKLIASKSWKDIKNSCFLFVDTTIFSSVDLWIKRFEYGILMFVY